MGTRRLQKIAVEVVALAILLGFAMVPSLALGDARSDYLVRLLRTSDAFRVRAQAALSLGQLHAEPAIVEALVGALRDDNSAVRAAAAESLERLGDPTALPALREAQGRDTEAQVRTATAHAIRTLERVPGRAVAAAEPSAATAPAEPRGTPRFYVGVGVPGTSVSAIDANALRNARSFIASRIGALDGVLVAPDSESSREAQQVIRQRRLAGYFLDSSIVSLETRADGGVRAAVSVVVQTYPDRNVRSMLSGSATVMGETGPAAQRTAIEAALTGALRNLGTALAAGPPR